MCFFLRFQELNRVRRAALSFGFGNLLDAIAALLVREVQHLPGNTHPSAAMQLQHAAEALRHPNAHLLDENILPMHTNYAQR